MNGMRLPSLALALLSALLAPACADGQLTLLAHAPEPGSAAASPHPPLIVLLHGSGADERDMIGLWHDLPPGFVVISPRAPFPGAGGGYVWYRKNGSTPRADDLAISRKVIDVVVANAIQRFDADPKRVFLAGFSQGAVMTYEVALREPGIFRGAGVLSGSLFAAEAAALSATTDRSREPFFVAHGTIDDRIPFAAATAAKTVLGRLGVPTAFHAYTGMGHTIGPEETRDFSAWLADQAGH
jgi:phospholipase/carboxylesterase